MLFTTLDIAVEVGFRLGLWVIYRWLDTITPYIRHIDEEELWYYRYPLVGSYVPKVYLYVMMIFVPGLVYLAQYLSSKGDKSVVRNISNQFYGITLAYVINGVFTNLLKIMVGRPRPNFFLSCFPDGYGSNVNAECTGPYDLQMNGRKSFPSAHSSFAFTGMVFITLHIFNVLDFSKNFFARTVVFVLAMLPVLLATCVAVSRTCDYNHHYADVIGGSLLGTMIAVLVFFIYSRTQDDKETDK